MDAGTCEGQTGGGPLDSLLMLFQPLAGKALGLEDLVGGVYTFNPPHQRIIELSFPAEPVHRTAVELSFPAGLVHRTAVLLHRANQRCWPRKGPQQQRL